jgi:hypothetical protein
MQIVIRQKVGVIYCISCIIMAMKTDTFWEVKKLSSSKEFDSKKLLSTLASNDVAAVQISDFYSPEDLASVVKTIQSQGILWYPNFEYKQGRIGICATEYHGKLNGKTAYFALEPEHTRIRKQVFSKAQDPIEKLLDLFSGGYETAIAREPGMGNAEYFSGIIRAMKSKSTTHFDYAPHQLPGWWVSNMEVQYSIVIYLQMPEFGGELTIYNRQWILDDEEHNHDKREKGPMGFDEAFLEEIDTISITARPGDIVIFNTKNFHKVEEGGSEKTRLTCNTFVGLSNNKLYLWS